MYFTKFSNLTVKPTSPHLVLHLLSYFLRRGTSIALWHLLQAVHLLDFTVERLIAAVFNVHLLTILAHCFCWHRVWPPVFQRGLPMAFPEKLGCWWDLSESGCFFLHVLKTVEEVVGAICAHWAPAGKTCRMCFHAGDGWAPNCINF